MSDVVSNRRQKQVHFSEFLDLDDVICEILSWLPAKSLLRFRCVCKAWRALISDPYFIRKHLSCINPKITTSYSLLIREELFRTVECEAVLKCLSHDRPLSKRTADFPVIIDPLIDIDAIAIVGSCNGLVCLLLDFFAGEKSLELFTFVLWNPCTGESQVLPLPPIHSCHTIFLGFGYDSTTNDYKVILGSCISEFLFVFTLKSGSWRNVEMLNKNYRFYGQWGYSVTGAVHWVLHEVENGWFMPSKIVSYDLAEENFHEIPFPFPPNPVDRPSLHAQVGVLNNCLTLYFQTNHCQPGCNFKMWVLKEYGVKESWTEVVNIPSEVLDDEYINYICTGCISENGEVLMQDFQGTGDDSLALYNPKEKKFRKLMDDGGWYETYTYIETLVSPLTGSTSAGV